MSTRCEIHIYGKTGEPFIRLYHHFGGYPAGVGCFLIEEVYPKLMSSNSDTAEDIAQFLVDHKADNEFEYTDGIHSDIEFLYEINVPVKIIKCFKGRYKVWNKRGHRLKNPYFMKHTECNLKDMFLPLNRKVKYK